MIKKPKKKTKTIASLFLIAPVVFRLSWSPGCTLPVAPS